MQRILPFLLIGVLTAFAATAHAQQFPGAEVDPSTMQEVLQEHTRWLMVQVNDRSNGAQVVATGGADKSMRQMQLVDGTKLWINREGKLHDLGAEPAVQYPGGVGEHYNNGVFLRMTGM